MNAQEWNKLRKNWSELCDSVYPFPIIEQLFENDVITFNDKKTVQKEKTPADKMEKLLSILKNKPSDKKSFDALMNALESDRGTFKLAECIKATETGCDASLKSEVDPHYIDSDVRTVLHENFVNKQGCSTKLSDIRDVLQKNGVFKKIEWKNKVLEDFVWKEFVGVEIQPKVKQSGKKCKKDIWFKNIGKIDKTTKKIDQLKEQNDVRAKPSQNTYQEYTALSESNLAVKIDELCGQEQESLNLKNEELNPEEPIENLPKKLEEIIPVQAVEHYQPKLEDMSSKQLIDYLHQKLVLAKLPTDILSEFLKENVTGSVFLDMKESDFKEFFAAATFGIRRFLSRLIDAYKHSSLKITYYEYLRKFNSEVQHTDKYFRGRCIDVNINARGRKTDPVRNFHLKQELDQSETAEFIASEVIPFASACLNDRRDGTIYFGINPPDDENFKPGEIIGVSVLREEVQAELRDFLQKSFVKNQQNVISTAVRDAKFVPVVSDVDTHQELNLWVVEIDVVPSSVILKNETVRTKLKCLPIHAKKCKSKDAMFRFSSCGMPEIISTDELYNYQKDLERIVQQRQEEETALKNVYSSSDLSIKLLNLLTGGAKVLQDTIFPFIITSSIDTHMDMDYISHNMAFIKYLCPEVVFDFDPTGSEEGIYKNLDSVQNEVMRVLTTDNFDKEQSSKEQYKQFIDSIANENRIQWVFCNGNKALDANQMEPTDWNKKRRNAFQESLRFYQDNFGKDRIIFIICLFSKKYEVMIEACDEVLTKFQSNWMLLADSENTVKLWQNQMLTRNKAEKQDIIDRCVTGMPWEHVNQTIKQAVSKIDLHDECQLPTSTGTLVDVREKKLKDWCDIDVLSAGNFNVQEIERERKKKEVEEQFYRGDQVSWLNFYFQDQVLKRDIHEELKQKVNDALVGNIKEEEIKVTSVVILHQPGAGGTTSARQILWDFRKIYRCCVVNRISDQTCDQLEEIRAYQDPYPKPLLILIDNEDEDKTLTLIGNLEERGRRISRSCEQHFNIYCTVISCTRRASLPKQIKQNQVALRQELTPEELKWFKDKNDSLESRFNNDKERNINPKFLISFNILRENFNKEYISKIVKEFSDDVKSTVEVTLLKIISLLNTYDLDFKPVPVSCLDKILEEKQISTSRGGYCSVRRSMKWEANLSQGVKVFLNLSSDKNQPGRARNSLRIFNKNIADEILRRMKERTGQKESEMMLELLESGIFELESSDAKRFHLLINNVIKKREFKANGIGKQKFSKFVIYVKINEGSEIAVKILEQLFDLNQDPFTAQLIARFYIELKNWSRAEDFAKRATSMLPTNSFLWDTYGQVFKNQLADKISPEGFRNGDIHGLLELSEKCIEVFRKEQKVSEQEETWTGDNNFAGYFGELRATVLILSALKMCPEFIQGETLHKYLIDENFQPHHHNFLNSDEISYVKNLGKSSKEAMRRLDEEYLQIKGSSNIVDMVSVSSDFDKKTLIDLKVNLDEYFGEASDSAPQNLGEPETCDYYRRRVKKLGATSLNSLLTLRQNGPRELIIKIYSLVVRNINARSCAFDDLRIILDTVTVLMIDNHIPPGLHFEQILGWCWKFYTMSKPQGTDRLYLETFLYFVLFNFPTEERQHYKLCLISDLSSAIEKWQDAFKKNYPKYGREGFRLKRETTLFFLGNGPPLNDIVHQDDLNEMESYSLTVKWDVPEVKKKLRMMSGILSNGGEKVKVPITTREGNRVSFLIQTSHRVTKRDMWQKNVYFYVGFSFSGPKAYGMSTQELGTMEGPVPKLHTHVYVPSIRMKQQTHPILSKLLKDKHDIEIQMRKEPKRKSELEGKLQRTESEIKKLIGE